MINVFLELEDEEQLEMVSFALKIGLDTVEYMLDDKEAQNRVRHLKNLTTECFNKNKAYLFEKRNKHD